MKTAFLTLILLTGFLYGATPAGDQYSISLNTGGGYSSAALELRGEVDQQLTDRFTFRFGASVALRDTVTLFDTGDDYIKPEDDFSVSFITGFSYWFKWDLIKIALSFNTGFSLVHSSVGDVSSDESGEFRTENEGFNNLYMDFSLGYKFYIGSLYFLFEMGPSILFHSTEPTDYIDNNSEYYENDDEENRKEIAAHFTFGIGFTF